ncbi:hypothetical protein ASE30_18490 [Achromobacter sp. Root83]|nr:hypothetical protein ASE30_18490 [Achromobacter sp. Root83]
MAHIEIQATNFIKHRTVDARSPKLVGSELPSRSWHLCITRQNPSHQHAGDKVAMPVSRKAKPFVQ